MTYRNRNIVIALVLALLAALLTMLYVTSYKRNVDKQHQSVSVPVAAKDIPVGTLGSEILARHLLTTKKVSQNAVVPGSIASPQQVASQIAVQPIYQGEQVLASRFGPIVEHGIRTELKGRRRALQITGSPEQLLSGTVEDGDHVDVVGVVTVKRTNGADITFARIVLRDLVVLRTSDSSAGGVAAPASGDGYVILRVTDLQAQKLALVYKTSEYWTLELRPPLRDADSPASIATPLMLLTDGLGHAQKRGGK